MALLPLLLAGTLALAGCGGSRDDPRRTSSGRADVAGRLADRGVDLSQWRTDFSRATVPLSEIRSGGPGKDGIPPIDKPTFMDVAQAARDLPAKEPVLVVEGRRTIKAYPLRILTSGMRSSTTPSTAPRSPSPSARCATPRPSSTAASPGAPCGSAPPAHCAGPTS